MRRILTLVALVFLAGCSSSSQSNDPESTMQRVTTPPATGATSTPSESLTSTGPGLPPVEDIVEAGAARFDVDDADWIQVIEGSAWTSLSSNVVVRLTPRSGEQTASIPTADAACLAMDVGFDSLWTGVCSDPAMVLRIDPRTAKVRASIPLPRQRLEPEGSLAVGAGAVWAVTTGPERQLLKIDPRTNMLVKGFPIPEGVIGARAGLGGLWLTDPSAGQVIRLDPMTGKTLAKVPTGSGARFFAVGAGGVWVQNNADGTVTRVDPETNQAVATIQVDQGAIDGGDLAIGGGFVWARVSGALVAKIDPRTNSVVARYGPGYGSGSVAAGRDALWVTAHDVDAVWRLPLR